MSTIEKTEKKNKVLKIIIDIIYDLIGGAFIAAGVYNFASAGNFPLTGFTGISLIINRMTGFPMGIMLILLNIPVGLICSKILGRRYFFNSLKSMFITSMMIDYVAPHFPVLWPTSSWP